jgi:hypothetical protein
MLWTIAVILLNPLGFRAGQLLHFGWVHSHPACSSDCDDFNQDHPRQTICLTRSPGSIPGDFLLLPDSNKAVLNLPPSCASKRYPANPH